METKPEILEMDANCSTVEAKKHEMELGYVSEIIRKSAGGMSYFR